jgi:predicted nucleotidyltransferase component of viral defense system
MEKKSISLDAERVLEKIKGLNISEDFYLAGGTALAIQLNHRESIDLDWFVKDCFSNNKIIELLSGIGEFKLNQEEEGTIHGVLDDVKISFLQYRYDLQFPLVEFKGVKIADEKDIAAMKLDAISSRGTKKDFIDLYFLLRKYSLEDLLKIFEKKYSDIKYNKVHLLKSLAFFEDAEDEPMPIMIEDIDWNEMKKELQEKTEDFLKK